MFLIETMKAAQEKLKWSFVYLEHLNMATPTTLNFVVVSKQPV